MRRGNITAGGTSPLLSRGDTILEIILAKGFGSLNTSFSNYDDEGVLANIVAEYPFLVNIMNRKFSELHVLRLL